MKASPTVPPLPRSRPTRGNRPGRQGRRAQRSQRRADALVRRQLDAGELPKVGGQRPHLTLFADLQTLQRQPGSRPPVVRAVRAGLRALPWSQLPLDLDAVGRSAGPREISWVAKDVLL